MHKSGLVLIAGLFLMSGAAFSQQGAYIGAGVGTAHSNVTQKANDVIFYTTLDAKAKSDTGYKIYAGYGWQYFALEAGYYDLGQYRLSGTLGVTPSADLFKAKAFGLSAVGVLPMGEQFSLYGKLGLASAHTTYTCIADCVGVRDTSKSSIVPVLGAGVSWNLAKHFALRADLETFRGAKTEYLGATFKANYELYSLSAEFRF